MSSNLGTSVVKSLLMSSALPLKPTASSGELSVAPELVKRPSSLKLAMKRGCCAIDKLA